MSKEFVPNIPFHQIQWLEYLQRCRKLICKLCNLLIINLYKVSKLLQNYLFKLDSLIFKNNEKFNNVFVFHSKKKQKKTARYFSPSFKKKLSNSGEKPILAELSSNEKRIFKFLIFRLPILQ